MDALPRSDQANSVPFHSWVYAVSTQSHNSAALSSAITRGYSDVVGNLLKSGVDWRDLDREMLSQLYGMISDSELKASVAAWAVANELEGMIGPDN
jgi:hypothetical protein